MKKCIIVALMVLMVVFIVTFSFSENYNQVIDTNNSMIGKLQAELKNKEKYKSELASDPNIRACADLENKINEIHNKVKRDFFETHRVAFEGYDLEWRGVGRSFHKELYLGLGMHESGAATITKRRDTSGYFIKLTIEIRNKGIATFKMNPAHPMIINPIAPSVSMLYEDYDEFVYNDELDYFTENDYSPNSTIILKSQSVLETIVKSGLVKNVVLLFEVPHPNTSILNIFGSSVTFDDNLNEATLQGQAYIYDSNYLVLLKQFKELKQKREHALSEISKTEQEINELSQKINELTSTNKLMAKQIGKSNFLTSVLKLEKTNVYKNDFSKTTFLGEVPKWEKIAGAWQFGYDKLVCQQHKGRTNRGWNHINIDKEYTNFIFIGTFDIPKNIGQENWTGSRFNDSLLFFQNKSLKVGIWEPPGQFNFYYDDVKWEHNVVNFIIIYQNGHYTIFAADENKNYLCYFEYDRVQMAEGSLGFMNNDGLEQGMYEYDDVCIAELIGK